MLRLFDSADGLPDFTTRYPLEDVSDETLETVTTILRDIRRDGWKPVKRYTRQFDDAEPGPSPVDSSRLDDAWEELTADQREAFRTAQERVSRYQNAIKPSSTLISDGASGKLGEIVRPLDTVGCYIPGGRFPLPSTVLMTACVAEVAGVDTIVVCTPPAGEGDQPHDEILAACSLLEGVEVFSVGGVQAIGAMTYGAGPVPSVDLIAGPGNLYVTLAKKEVFGRVDIDMLAGPSEICVIAEPGESRPRWIAADLLSQAEHDPESRVYGLSSDRTLLEEVKQEVENLLEDHPAPDPVREALDHSALVLTEDTEHAVELSNQLAPEHLELHVDSPEAVARRCRNAGAIFAGPYSPEPLGDYTAGPSHTLPTGGTARFFSPLSVRTFMKSQSFLGFDQDGFEDLEDPTETLASMESLEAHYWSLNVRTDGDVSL